MNHKKNSTDHSPEIKTALRNEAERKLLPRLKFMGYTMSLFTLASFGYALFAEQIHYTEVPPLEGSPFTIEDASFEPLAHEVLNFFVVSGVFAAVGAGCFFLYFKGNKVKIKK